MLANRILDFFTSLKLAVACLAAAAVLVFIGTLAQVKMGLYTAQEVYFQSLFVYWTPGDSGMRIPVWPGGYLLGTVLLVNLVASHVRRFKYTRKKAGILLIHFGLILLLLGQFFTEVFQVESHMTLSEGEAKNYSEAGRRSELAIIDVTNPEQDRVVAIPESLLADGGEIRHPELPFPIRIHSYYQNSEPVAAGAGLTLNPAPLATKMNDRNVPAANIEIVGAPNAKWTFSNWFSEGRLAGWVRRTMGITTPAGVQRFEHSGKRYEVTMRPERYYKPHWVQLLDFKHDRYKGTEIPMNFSSRIKLNNPDSGENREILIYMNNPLRYAGETYYQGGFDPEANDTISILQVVRNPSWVTPYVSCVLVGVGLIVQFMTHLIAFGKKRRTA